MLNDKKPYPKAEKDSQKNEAEWELGAQLKSKQLGRNWQANKSARVTGHLKENREALFTKKVRRLETYPALNLRTAPSTTPIARSICSIVVMRPREKRIVPLAHSKGTCMALSTWETETVSEWQAAPGEAATSGSISAKGIKQRACRPLSLFIF
jgi:hypothetical protein